MRGPRRDCGTGSTPIVPAYESTRTIGFEIGLNTIRQCRHQPKHSVLGQRGSDAFGFERLRYGSRLDIANLSRATQAPF